MSSEVQPRPDDSPNTSGGSSDAEQRDVAPAVQPEEREREREREQAPPKKKEAKFSSKTPAKLSTSAKRWATATESRQIDHALDLAVFSHIRIATLFTCPITQVRFVLWLIRCSVHI